MGNMITFVCGPIGAGKTTYVKENAPEEALIIDWDDTYQELLKENVDYEFNVVSEATWITNQQLAKCVAIDQECWISGTLPTTKELNILKGVDVRWIWIDTPLKQTIENIKKRGRGKEAQSIHFFIQRNQDIIDKRDWFIETFNAEVVSMNEERW